LRPSICAASATDSRKTTSALLSEGIEQIMLTPSVDCIDWTLPLEMWIQPVQPSLRRLG